MKSSIVIIGIGLGIGFFACTADLRDKNVCVMYARALCDKGVSCGIVTDKNAEECLAPYLDKLCEDRELKSTDPDPRACGAAIENAPCPGDNPVPVPECKQNLSKDDLINFAYKDGLFADAESTERAVHAALISTLRNEQIRQLQDGTFAPVTLAQTVRFRRAV